MPMACSQSSTVPIAEDASGLPGSSRVVLGLKWVENRKKYILGLLILINTSIVHSTFVFTIYVEPFFQAINPNYKFRWALQTDLKL